MTRDMRSHDPEPGRAAFAHLPHALLRGIPQLVSRELVADTQTPVSAISKTSSQPET